ncbi:hypothetical protein [Frankia sp. Cppng1_Ct_nod]|uniref:hypothetical protein n=1 Tax=Frankia sp. Cppng1_Ct_nod TaxID=2897162 RepID=UPI00104197C1|nr:hypothetical protein [Frankia sp. Cppng1_Ct_nod]
MMSVAFAPVTAADLGLPSPQAISAALPLFVMGVLMGLRRLPRAAACLALVAGAALSAGWLHTAIRHLLGWIIQLIDLVSRHTVGGVVHGALAIVLLIYFVVALRPGPDTVGKLALLRDDPRALVPFGSGSTRRYDTRIRGRVPDKLGAAGVGLVLPSVAVTIPGSAGAVVLTVLNVVGGAFAWLLSLAFGAA